MFGGVVMEYVVNFMYDEEANVWIATSEDIPGLVLENESLDKLMSETKDAAKELIELNHLPMRAKIRYRSERCQAIA